MTLRAIFNKVVKIWPSVVSEQVAKREAGSPGKPPANGLRDFPSKPDIKCRAGRFSVRTAVSTMERVPAEGRVGYSGV